MKILSVILIAVTLYSPIISAKEYILDKEDHLPPVGTVLVKQFMMNMLDSKLTLTEKGKTINGSMESTSSKIEVREVLSPTKYRTTLKHNVTRGKIEINGREVLQPEKVEPLLNIPVFMEIKDGKWSATPEKGEFNEEQQKKANKLEKKANSKASMYGYHPRKIGDVWDVNLETLKQIINDDSLTKGIATIVFKGVEEHKGVVYADLVVRMQVERVAKEGQTLKMDGEVSVMRNIEFMVDAKMNGKINMSMKSEAKPGLIMKVDGKSMLDMEISIKRSENR